MQATAHPCLFIWLDARARIVMLTQQRHESHSRMAGAPVGVGLIKITNDLLIAADSGHISILMLLDLSTAFDTISHTILLTRLSDYLGLTGTALSWFQSYLTNRKQFVTIGDFSSTPAPVNQGVPQGSVLGPLSGLPSKILDRLQYVQNSAVGGPHLHQALATHHPLAHQAHTSSPFLPPNYKPPATEPSV